MALAPGTHGSLLLRVRDSADGPAWAQFVQIYAPLIYGFARKKGLQDADAADLTQDVLTACARALRGLEYDPARGSFRGWLFTAVRRQLARFWQRRSRQAQGTGDTEMLHVLGEQVAPEEEATWDLDFERRLFHWAAAQVRHCVSETSWQAFQQTALDARDPKDVARTLGLTVAAVYMAKSRVLARIKELIEEAQNAQQSGTV